MSNIFKDTKFWMYLPFACIFGTKMLNWVIDTKSIDEKSRRSIFYFLNIIVTFFSLLVFLLII